jgi:hypothetical protein
LPKNSSGCQHERPTRRSLGALSEAHLMDDSVEIHREHLAFLRSHGELSALFLFEIVKDWSEIEP